LILRSYLQAPMSQGNPLPATATFFAADSELV
jgi:hypothetical protein